MVKRMELIDKNEFKGCKMKPTIISIEFDDQFQGHPRQRYNICLIEFERLFRKAENWQIFSFIDETCICKSKKE